MVSAAGAGMDEAASNASHEEIVLDLEFDGVF